MRVSPAPLVNGALLFAVSFWLGECRSANNEFFDSVSVDHSPWQPIANNREPQRPSSPKFPPIRYSNPNHAGSSPTQWHPGFNRHPTTEKLKDSDRIGPNNKPKFTPPLSVDGYKSYSPGPFYNPNTPDFFESQPPFKPFADDFRPPQDSKRIPAHGIKPTKESPAPVYKESGEPPVLPKLKPITPSSFDLPPELHPGPASFSAHPHNVYSDGRKKLKLPAPTGSGVVFQNEKLNSLKGNGRYPPLENDRNSVKDFNETGTWKDHVHEVQITNGNKNRGPLKFYQNGVSVREVSSAEAPASESNTLKNQNQKLGSGLRLPQNRTGTTGSRSEVRVGTNSANELKPDFNKQTHAIYSDTAQLVEDGPPSGLSDNEEFHPKEFGPGNIIKQITSVRTRESTIKPPQVDSVRTSSAEQSKSKPQFVLPQIFENSTEKFQPQNELANTVPIVESIPNSNFDKTKEPVSASEETNSSEAKKKFPFRRPQLLSTTSTEKPTTYEPPRRPTLKSSLKTRVNLNQSSKFRTTTESLTTMTPASATESPVRVKNHKEDASVQSNDIPLKPSIKPLSEFNPRRRPVNKTNQNEVNLPPSGWALASFKNFTASRSTRRPPTEPPAVGVTELPAKVKPFVAWSTRLQKVTTTDNSNMDMTTLMDDSEEETTTAAMDTMKNINVSSSTPSSHSNSKNVSLSSEVSNKIPSVNTTASNNTVFSAEEMNNSRNRETNENKSMNQENDNKDDVSIDNDAASPDDDGDMPEDEVSSTENEGSTSESGLSTHDSEKGIKKEEKVDISDAASLNHSTSPSKFPPFSAMKNEVSSSSKDSEANSGQDSETDVVESSVDDANKPTEKLKIPSENDEIEFVEATNSSNAHGLYDSNDLKTKPVETIYLTDVKPGVVGFTNSVVPTFQKGKGSEILTVTNSSSLENFVNNTKNETRSTSLFNNVPLFSSTDSVPFSKNYQNNSSQSSNELNTENEFGILKGVSSQLDLGGRNKSRIDSTTSTVHRLKDLNEYSTETDGLFEVSFDSPADKTSSSTEGNFTSNVSEKGSYSPSTVSSIPSSSNEEIPDFEFSSPRPHLSSELSGNASSSSSSDEFSTKSTVKNEKFDKTTTDLELGTRVKDAGKLSTPNREKPTSRIPNTTVSIQFVSPETETTIKSVEKTNPPNEESKTTGTTNKILDLNSRSSTTESVSVTNWAGPINFRTSTRMPSSKVAYTTPKTSAIPLTTVSSTMKLLTSTKKHENIIPLNPDKFDENDTTDEDVYIETDVEQDSTPTSSTKIVAATTKSPTTNMSSEVSESDLCPSTTLCPVPLHIQLRIETSQSEVCKTQNKLKNAIIKLFRSGTARVHLPEQIKFINLNFKECMKGDSAKMTDVNFYLSDGIGDFEQSINEEFLELYRKMGLSDYEQKVESAHLVMNKDNDSTISVGSDMDHSKTRVIAAVVIICLALICLILVILLLLIIRKRQKHFNYGQRCVPVTLDDYSLDNISVYNSVRRKGDARASKRSYGNPAFDDPNGPTHRMNFAGLAKFTSDQNAIDEEFASIPVVAVKPDELPPSAETKNRYANVIPLPETRVHLINTKSGGSSDYINANYVKGPKREEKFYVACQAPLQSTIEDFWRMIWEQQSKVILMLTDFFESGVEKCANYLPPSEVIDCNRVFGDFQVTLKKRENREKYIISSLQLKNLETNSWREVTHLWYTSWPPLGVPNEESSIIAFLIEARVYMKNNSGPNIIHCSPGTGRTGTVIACDLCIRDFEVTRMVDVPKCVYMLRRCRAGAVQTKQQYAFIYKVLNLYAAKLTGGGLDSI